MNSIDLVLSTMCKNGKLMVRMLSSIESINNVGYLMRERVRITLGLGVCVRLGLY